MSTRTMKQVYKVGSDLLDYEYVSAINFTCCRGGIIASRERV